jgi:uncharacterized LabA/DUF88 family protein
VKAQKQNLTKTIFLDTINITFAPRRISSRASGGVIYKGKCFMFIEPAIKRTYVFFDGQNLYYASKEAFGYRYPNYAPWLLAKTVCQQQGWQLDKIFFYTGVPSASDNPFWNHFWTKKLAVMGTRGVSVYSRELRYRNKSIILPDGAETSILIGQEKGIDIRIALDIISHALDGAFDVALVFSQDEDLSEVADDVRKISMNQSRWIKIASAFPISPTSRNTRGINKTDWIKINKDMYDSCIDKNDYRKITKK